HNTHFTANCVVEQDGRPVLNSEGEPLIKSFFFDAADVRILPVWNAFGLRATASHSFEVNKLWVAPNRSFVISPENATIAPPLYQYPFLPFAQTTLAANTLGMARHFLECCNDIASSKRDDPAGVALSELTDIGHQRLMEVRQTFYETLDRSWEALIQHGQISENIMHAIAKTNRYLVEISHQTVISLYPHCGFVAAYGTSPIYRITRSRF